MEVEKFIKHYGPIELSRPNHLKVETKLRSISSTASPRLGLVDSPKAVSLRKIQPPPTDIFSPR